MKTRWCEWIMITICDNKNCMILRSTKKRYITVSRNMLTRRKKLSEKLCQIRAKFTPSNMSLNSLEIVSGFKSHRTDDERKKKWKKNRHIIAVINTKSEFQKIECRNHFVLRFSFDMVFSYLHLVSCVCEIRSLQRVEESWCQKASLKISQNIYIMCARASIHFIVFDVCLKRACCRLTRDQKKPNDVLWRFTVIYLLMFSSLCTFISVSVD